MHIYVCMYIYICMYTYIYTCIYEYMYIHVCVLYVGYRCITNECIRTYSERINTFAKFLSTPKSCSVVAAAVAAGYRRHLRRPHKNGCSQ